MFFNGPPHMAEIKQDEQLEPTYSSSLRIRYVALRTCRKRWTIGRSGERGSGMSVMAARHDDDAATADDDDDDDDDCISTLVGYLMPEPFYAYVLNIHEF